MMPSKPLSMMFSDGVTWNNVIIGTDVGETLSGTAGNDMLDGMIGADTMKGGLGNDTYVVDASRD